MAYLEFKQAKDSTQSKVVSIRQDQLTAVIEVDAKKTELMLAGGESVFCWGSYSEVMAKVRAAEV